MAVILTAALVACPVVIPQDQRASNGVSLIGVWQADDSLLAAGWRDTYCFFETGQFDFHFSQFSYATRILGLHGRYYTVHDTLYTKILWRSELVGGYVKRDDPLFLGEWQISDCRRKRIKQNSEWEYAVLRPVRFPTSVLPRIRIDGRLYFRISQDPRYYH